MGRLGDFLFPGERPKDPVRGQAQVVTCSAYNRRGIREICTMHLVVEGDGVPPTAMEYARLVHRDKWPEEGMTLPVTIDRANPRKFEIEWDEVPDARERAAQKAELVAKEMRRKRG